MKATLIIATMLMSGTVLAQPIEWLVSEGGNGHYYEPMGGVPTVSWLDAFETAASRTHDGKSGHLLTLTSAEEEVWITTNFLADNFPDMQKMWLGGWCIPDGTWFWITGEPWEYENWAYGEPSDTYEDNSYLLGYLYLYPVTYDDIIRTGFNDEWHRMNRRYIIEYDDIETLYLPGNIPVGDRTTSWSEVKALYR